MSSDCCFSCVEPSGSGANGTVTFLVSNTFLFDHTSMFVLCSDHGRSPAAIVGSNPTEGMDVCMLCVVR
jgi:hypothetical protein